MDIANLAVPIQRLSDNSIWESADYALEMGISAMTFFGMPRPYPAGEPPVAFLWDELDLSTRKAIYQLRAKFDRGVIHAPFTQTPLVSPNPYIEREARRQILMSIRAAGALDLETVTVHAGLPEGLTQGEFDPRLIEALQILGDEAERAGTRIGLENWRYPATPDDHIRLLQAIDHPGVGATLDVGHICYWLQQEGINRVTDEAGISDYHEQLHALIERIGPYIAHVHLHDVQPDPLKDHSEIGRGILDFSAIVQHLGKVGFDGLMLFEIASPNPRQAQADGIKVLVEAMHGLS